MAKGFKEKIYIRLVDYDYALLKKLLTQTFFTMFFYNAALHDVNAWLKLKTLDSVQFMRKYTYSSLIYVWFLLKGKFVNHKQVIKWNKHNFHIFYGKKILWRVFGVMSL